ncbi:MAG: DUF2262 domain-containing protein [Anaerotruncus sp.]|jgi:hypothetical protein|nr:DUF2262 domain-containing protein [Anaerotruncus sp.]
MQPLKAEQFYQEAYINGDKPLYDAEIELDIWGQSCHLGFDFTGELSENLPEIQRMLELLENSRAAVEQAILAYGMCSVAEDWVSGGEPPEDYDMESDEDPEYYYTMEDEKVYLPITEEAFLASLRLDGGTVYLDEKPEESYFDLFLYCKPDYFAGHVIEVFVEGDGNIKVNGLAG